MVTPGICPPIHLFGKKKKRDRFVTDSGLGSEFALYDRSPNSQKRN